MKEVNKIDHERFLNAVESLVDPETFYELGLIGGHKVYHLEGSALVHTEMVFTEAVKIFGEGHFMTKVALLHDIGKIYTSICYGPNDWKYPDHAACGAFRGILCKFVPEDDPMFKVYQWYIANHIKPLYWKGDDRSTTRKPEGLESYCTINNLAMLAVCDIRGSISVIPQTELENRLIGIATTTISNP